MNLRFPIFLAAAVPVTLAIAAANDQVTLSDGGLLRGSVSDLSAAGAVTLSPEIATGKVVIPREALNNIRFAQSEAEPESHSSMVGLRNGDSLPCEVLDLDGSQVRIRTWYSGEHALPRAAVASVFLGVRPQRSIYVGPDDLPNWTETSGWRFEENSLIANERGTIRRDLKLPENYILRFRLAWEGTPNFIVDFAEVPGKQKPSDDRYRFAVNAGGVDLKRGRPGNRWTPPLFTSGPMPAMMAAGEAEFEFRVDRKRREVHIFIDGRWAKRAIDASSPALPTGTGISIQCLGNNQGPQQVKMLEVLEWDAMTQRNQNEGPGAGPNDSAIDSEGQRFSGHIREINKAGVVMENPHSDGGVMTIPLTEVSTLYLAGPEAKPADPQTMTLNLRTAGQLSVMESHFVDKFLVCEHPMLGALRVDRRALDSLYTSLTPAPEKP
jgi:hypothetical protein